MIEIGMKKTAFFIPIVLLAILTFSLKTTNSNLCANAISCIKNLTGLYEDNSKVGIYLGKTIKAPQEIARAYPQTPVLGESTGNKRIDINLSTQHLYAYEGDKVVYDFPVSSGKWAPTPTGTFNIWIKLRYTRMEGGNKDWGTYYNLPNVPFTMYFYNSEIPKSRGFGIHGAYWHNNFGHPMSHGCVNMKTEDVEKLYNWADPPTAGNVTYATKETLGTKVVIHGTTPEE